MTRLTGADFWTWLGLRRVGLTETGRSRYRELCREQRRRPDLPVPPEQFATTRTPDGR